ncbi:hypothetical protein PR202_ga12910 [Eleusine coracana subsp. coracana]|uniref:Uncharacterized protein n=1 Tax=Eleusine coracana subsp. coracana TaxID=191504 RepID=A0AAV5CDC6_ELECO|nr:hypothetical protein PR202_ga12910 [Eleusine coracana subsp. coracana]
MMWPGLGQVQRSTRAAIGSRLDQEDWLVSARKGAGNRVELVDASPPPLCLAPLLINFPTLAAASPSATRLRKISSIGNRLDSPTSARAAEPYLRRRRQIRRPLPSELAAPPPQAPRSGTSPPRRLPPVFSVELFPPAAPASPGFVRLQFDDSDRPASTPRDQQAAAVTDRLSP